jgi:hypothetical protein
MRPALASIRRWLVDAAQSTKAMLIGAGIIYTRGMRPVPSWYTLRRQIGMSYASTGRAMPSGVKYSEVTMALAGYNYRRQMIAMHTWCKLTNEWQSSPHKLGKRSLTAPKIRQMPLTFAVMRLSELANPYDD